MSLTQEGIWAERKAREIFVDLGWMHQQLDWIVKVPKKDGFEWVIIEVKHRELFKPPPFFGTGLDHSQIFLRKQLQKDLGIRTMLMVFDKDSNKVYYQYLDVLEETEYFDTRNKIRIYNIEHYMVYETS